MLPGITEGKRARLQAVSNTRGVIAALAIDQRSAMKKLFAKAIGCEPAVVPAEKIVQSKEAVSRVLTPHARVPAALLGGGCGRARTVHLSIGRCGQRNVSIRARIGGRSGSPV